jgi:chemotaxis methyl-accepting protein methylase
MAGLISFVNSSVEARYRTILERTVSPQGRDRAELIADITTGEDGILDEKEIETFENYLNYYNVNQDHSFSCSYFIQYDDQEIQAAWEGVFGETKVDDEFFQLMGGIPHPYWRTILALAITRWESVGECFLRDPKLRKILFQHLANLSQIKGFDRQQFIRFVGFIREKAEDLGLFYFENGRKVVEPEYGTYSIEGLLEKFRYYIEINAQINEDQIAYELTYEDYLSQPTLSYEEILSFAEHPNPFVRQRVLFALGSNQMRPDLILSSIDREKTSSHLVRTGFDALAYFEDKNTAREIFKRLAEISFEASLPAKNALVNYANPQAVISVALDYFKYPDFFKRGAAVSILRYFDPKAFSEETREKIREALNEFILNPYEDRLVIGLAKKSLRVWEGTEPPAKADFNWMYFQTGFFRYPAQTAWVIKKIKELAKENEPVTVLSTGGSTGNEAISIAIAALEDYRLHPEEWGGFDPRQQLKITVSDINLDALLYARRGCYTSTVQYEIDDFEGLRLHALQSGLDPQTYQNRYFLSKTEKTYQLDPVISEMIRTEPLDILSPQEYLRKYGEADIVLYNNIDIWLPDDATRVYAAENIALLSGKYIATTSTGDEYFDATNRGLETHARRVGTIGTGHAFFRRL